MNGETLRAWALVAVSLFTAVTVTRLFMSIIVDSRVGQDVRMYGVSPKEIGS